MKITHILLFCVLFVGLSPHTQGATRMEVKDSFTRESPFGAALNIRYEHSKQRADIMREYLGAPSPTRVILLDQLRTETITSIVHYELQVGLYRDFEFVVRLPQVLNQQTIVGFHPNILAQAKAQNKDPRDVQLGLKDIDPGRDAWKDGDGPILFDLPHEGPNRSGLGNVELGLRWLPWNQKLRPSYPSWLLALMVELPTAQVKRADNQAVGDGVTRVKFNTMAAHRVLPFLEPFFSFDLNLAVHSSSESLFKQYNPSTQGSVRPASSLGMMMGAELFAWEDSAKDRFVSLDFGGGFSYFLNGRGYSQLFDALGSSPCRTSSDCLLTTYDRDIRGIKDQQAVIQHQYKLGKITKEKYETDMANLERTLNAAMKNDSFSRTDGITDIQSHLVLKSFAGLHIQPVKYLYLGVDFNLAWTQPHFITNADPGKDANDDVRVDAPTIVDTSVTGYNFPHGVNEYNPVYLKEIDYPGRRFKLDTALEWSLVFSISGKF